MFFKLYKNKITKSTIMFSSMYNLKCMNKIINNSCNKTTNSFNQILLNTYNLNEINNNIYSNTKNTTTDTNKNIQYNKANNILLTSNYIIKVNNDITFDKNRIIRTNIDLNLNNNTIENDKFISFKDLLTIKGLIADNNVKYFTNDIRIFIIFHNLRELYKNTDFTIFKKLFTVLYDNFNELYKNYKQTNYKNEFTHYIGESSIKGIIVYYKMLVNFFIANFITKGGNGMIFNCYNYIINSYNNHLFFKYHKNTANKFVPTQSIFNQEIVVNDFKDCKNIIKFEQCEYYDYLGIIKMPFYENGSLYDYILNNNKFFENSLNDFAYQIINTVLYLHKEDYIHNDIKPDNILIDYYEKKLIFIDFSNGFYLKNVNENSAFLPSTPIYTHPLLVKLYIENNRNVIYSQILKKIYSGKEKYNLKNFILNIEWYSVLKTIYFLDKNREYFKNNKNLFKNIEEGKCEKDINFEINNIKMDYTLKKILKFIEKNIFKNYVIDDFIIEQLNKKEENSIINLNKNNITNNNIFNNDFNKNFNDNFNDNDKNKNFLNKKTKKNNSKSITKNKKKKKTNKKNNKNTKSANIIKIKID